MTRSGIHGMAHVAHGDNVLDRDLAGGLVHGHLHAHRADLPERGQDRGGAVAADHAHADHLTSIGTEPLPDHFGRRQSRHSTQLGAGITLANSQISAQLGAGITLANSQISTQLGAGITLANSQISTQLGAGITLANSQISAQLGAGITLANSQISTQLGAGITLANSQISAQLGAGITLADGNGPDVNQAVAHLHFVDGHAG